MLPADSQLFDACNGLDRGFDTIVESDRTNKYCLFVGFLDGNNNGLKPLLVMFVLIRDR